MIRSLLVALTLSLTLAALLWWPGRQLTGRMLPETNVASALPIAGAILIGRTFERLLSDAFRGLRDIRLATLFGGFWTQALATVLFGSLLVSVGSTSLTAALGLYGIASISGPVIGFLRLRRDISGKPGESTGPNVQDLLRESWPVAVFGITTAIMQRADLWVVAALLTADDAGLYGAALRVVAVIALPLNIANQVVPPLVSRLYSQGQGERLQRAMRTTATLTAVPALAGLLVVAVFGDSILGLVFGEFYTAADTVLAILAAGQVASVLAGSIEVAFVQTGRQRTLMRISLSAAALMVVGSSVGSLAWGLIGAATAAASALALQNVLLVANFHRHTGLKTYVGINETQTAVVAAFRRRFER